MIEKESVELVLPSKSAEERGRRLLLRFTGIAGADANEIDEEAASTPEALPSALQATRETEHEATSGSTAG